MTNEEHSKVSLHRLEGQSRLRNCSVIPAHDQRMAAERPTLIVWVHAYVWDDQRQEAMRDFLAQKYPGADLLMPRYRGGLSNENPCWLAAELARLVAQTYESSAGGAGGRYQQVVFIGYSAGALLMRKAIVYGLGQLQDHPFPELGREVAKCWREIRPLCRVVLLAGMNRGWSLETKPVEWSAPETVGARALLSLVRAIPVIGRFILSLERGAPFVANLRVQWIRLSQALGAEMPPVIQLLGGQDGIVSKADNKDVLVSRDFIFIPVAYSNHRTIVAFDDPDDGKERVGAICDAIGLDIDVLRDRYKGASQKLLEEEIPDREKETSEPSAEPPQLVFLVHGIRDNSDWPRELARVIRKQADGKIVRCVTSSYGHFPMLHFLLFNKRRKNVRWFMDRYTEEIAKQPDAEVHFAGHSNGTYLLAEGLRTYQAMTFNRVVFMGSVVPSNFPWRRYYSEHRLKEFRNDRASGDWVVGIFPAFFQLLGTVLPFRFFRDLGDGGFRGFDQSVGDKHRENFYFDGGHGEATKSPNHPSLARFLLTGVNELEVELVEGDPRVETLSRLCWLIWLVAASILIGIGGWVLTTFGGWALAGYAAFVFMVLVTI